MVQPIAPNPAHYYAHGCKATTTRVERIMPTVKSLNYIGAIMAVSEASKSGAVEAIYRDAHDHLTEGTRANFFVFQGNHLITPGEGILPGITRQVVLEVAPPEFDIIESPIAYADLATVDEAFLTSTTGGVVPVVQIDAARIANGRPGPVAMRLREAYFRTMTGAP